MYHEKNLRETIKNFSALLIHRIDSWLWIHGIRIGQVRIVIRNLFLINILFLLIAICTLPFTLLPLSFTLASFLSSYGFYTLASHIILNLSAENTEKISSKVLIKFSLRGMSILFISLIGIVVFNLSMFAWLMGLGVPLLLIPFVVLK